MCVLVLLNIGHARSTFNHLQSQFIVGMLCSLNYLVASIEDLITKLYILESCLP